MFAHMTGTHPLPRNIRRQFCPHKGISKSRKKNHASNINRQIILVPDKQKNKCHAHQTDPDIALRYHMKRFHPLKKPDNIKRHGCDFKTEQIPYSRPLLPYKEQYK